MQVRTGMGKLALLRVALILIDLQWVENFVLNVLKWISLNSYLLSDQKFAILLFYLHKF